MELRGPRKKADDERSITLDRMFDSLGTWLIDVYLISALLIVIGGLFLMSLRQPARRMAVARSVSVGLVAISVLAARQSGRVPAYSIGTQTNSTQYRAIGRLRPRFEPLAATTAFESKPSTLIKHEPTVPTFASGVVSVSSLANRVRPSYERLPWRYILGLAFILGATLNLAWLALGAFEAMRLRRSGLAADARIQEVMARVKDNHRQETRLFVSDRIGLPVALGVLRPAIVLPVTFIVTEPDDRLEAALAHEWAHIRNSDLRWLAVLRLLNLVLFAHPLSGGCAARSEPTRKCSPMRRPRRSRAMAAWLMPRRSLGWARSSHRPRPGALASAALALWERPSMLDRRVRLLLDRDYRVEPATSRRWKLASACIGVLAALLLSTISLRPPAATAQEMKATQGRTTLRSSTRKIPRSPPIHSNTRAVYSIPTISRSPARNYTWPTLDYQGQAPPAIRATSDARRPVPDRSAQGRFRRHDL